jgi:LmbE family N-acetylglucosaminyl deacetylase
MNVLVIGAHPDDEILGVGGTIINHIQKGDKVHVLILTDGESARDSHDRELRDDALHKAGRMLGLEKIYKLGFEDQRLDTIPFIELTKKIEEIASEVNPQVVYTHYWGDVNIDHQIAFKACLTAFRPVGNHPSRMFAYETMSSTEWGSPADTFNPNHYVDISDSIALKLQAMQAYTGELRAYPHPRSLKGIEESALKWGKLIGVSHAEAFVLVRSIEK